MKNGRNSRGKVRIFLFADDRSNSGPANAIRPVIRELPEEFSVLQGRGKLKRRLEAFSKCVACDVLVVSGVSKLGSALMTYAGIFKKRTVYIAHGCAEYEIELNRQPAAPAVLQQERNLLQRADLILPVSEVFMRWMQERYPDFKEKMKYWYCGFEPDRFCGKGDPMKKRKGSVAVAGGDIPLKNNAAVVRAVQATEGGVSLTVFGSANGPFGESEKIRYMGSLPRDRFVEELAKQEVFVLNSLHESFSVATIEALLNGCSVLVSVRAGIAGILPLEETDRINDPENENEIRQKILHLLEHPNRERLLSKIDLSQWTYRKAAERLKHLCVESR